MERIKRNAIRCKHCGEVIESRSTYDDQVIEYKEILHEAFAGLLADISKLILKKGISSDSNDPLCVLEEQIAAIWRDIIGDKYSSMDDMMKLRGQYEFIKAYLQRMA